MELCTTRSYVATTEKLKNLPISLRYVRIALLHTLYTYINYVSIRLLYQRPARPGENELEEGYFVMVRKRMGCSHEIAMPKCWRFYVAIPTPAVSNTV